MKQINIVLNRKKILFWFMMLGCLWFSRYFSFYFDDTTEGRSYQGPNSIFQMISLFFYSGSFFLVLKDFENFKRSVTRNLSALLLVGLSILSIFWSVDADVTGRRAFALVGMLCFSYVLATHVSKTNDFSIVVNVLMFGIVSSLLVAMFIPSIGIDNGGLVDEHYGLWQGVFGFKNTLGQVCAVAICILLPFWNHTKTKIFVLISLFVLFKTGSTTSVVCVLIVIAMLFLLSLLARKEYIKLLSILCFSVVLGFIVFLNLDYIVYDVIGKDYSASGRTEIWSQISDSYSNELMGYGYGGVFWGDLGPAYNYMDDFYISLGHSHNGYIDARLELGLMGLLLYVLSLVMPLLSIRPDENNSLCRIKFSIFVFLIVYSFTGSSFMRSNSFLLFIFFFGTFLNSSNKLRKQ